MGGVTIEGPTGDANNIANALVVVSGGSRILASTSGTRATSNSITDVHALGVVTVEASTTDSRAASYDSQNARRANAATIQALPGARVEVALLPPGLPRLLQ